MKSANNNIVRNKELPYKKNWTPIKIHSEFRERKILDGRERNKECMDLLNNNSQGLSFKGSFNNKAPVELKKILQLADDSFGEYITKTLQNITKKTKKTYFNYDEVNGTVAVVPRKAFDFFKESITYPILQMPFDLLDFVANLMKKCGITSLYDAKFLQNYREKIKLKKQADSLTGFFDNLKHIVTDKCPVESLDAKDKESIRKHLTNSAQKMFSDKTGHYDAAKERALNRIVSGVIPAFFLANDAYNLSRLINDNPNEAKTESKTRFSQELMRVFATAYCQLVLLGGFSKFVNKSKWASAGLSLGIVLFTETTSRLWNGKPITFVSKDKAVKFNKKSNSKNSTQTPPLSVKETKIKQPDSLLFKTNLLASAYSVSSLNKMQKDLSGNFVNNFNVVNKKQPNIKKEKKKEFFSMATLGKWTALSVGGGLTATYARKFGFVEKSYKKFTGVFQRAYNKLTTQKSNISKEEFDVLVNKLSEFGFKTQANLYKKAYSDKIKDGIVYLGEQDRKSKSLVNLAIGPFKFLWNSLAFPFKLFKLVFEIAEPGTKSFFSINQETLQHKKQNYGKAIALLNKKMKEFNNDSKFKEYLYENTLDSFNEISQSRVSNADLAKLVKIVSSGATSCFLIADNYNMVMLKSNGENKKDAAQKAKERAVQRISSLFYQMLLIDLFNSTFKKLYHSSLAGMSIITSSCTLCQELITRKAIGMPILPHSKDEITAIEEKNNNKKGFIGAYYRFMTELTGKKQLSSMNKQKNKTEQKSNNV